MSEQIEKERKSQAELEKEKTKIQALEKTLTKNSRVYKDDILNNLAEVRFKGKDPDHIVVEASANFSDKLVIKTSKNVYLTV